METPRIWSDQQNAIFEFFRRGYGNLVVRARAGTGKTTTIIEAVKHAPEQKILLAAFNKRIQMELEQKLAQHGGDSRRFEAKTLHSLGFAFIRRQWDNVKVDASVDDARARAAAGKSAPDEIVAMVKKLAGLLKNCEPFTTATDKVMTLGLQFDCVPDEEWNEDGWDAFKICNAALAARDAAKERDATGRISFDDMVYIPLANGFARPWFNMVVVDEAQDMNAAQLALAMKACKRTGRIVVVGDDRQAIYGFRGADSGSIDRLKEELDATELGLTVTYRCGRAIVDVAAKLVKDFTAAPTNADGTVDTVAYDKLYDEALPGDFILSRKNAPLMPICLGFLKRGVRCRIEGRDIGAGLQAIVKKFNARSVAEFIERVQGWLKKQTKRTEKIGDQTKREAKLEEVTDQAELLISLADGAVSVSEILARTELLFEDTPVNGGLRQPTIVCSSVHKAKGLEADRVFVLAATVNTRTDEEANIFYVAVTRAKKHLSWVKPGATVAAVVKNEIANGAAPALAASTTVRELIAAEES